jgi:hypothetical protein
MGKATSPEPKNMTSMNHPTNVVIDIK